MNIHTLIDTKMQIDTDTSKDTYVLIDSDMSKYIPAQFPKLRISTEIGLAHSIVVSHVYLRGLGRELRWTVYIQKP